MADETNQTAKPKREKKPRAPKSQTPPAAAESKTEEGQTEVPPPEAAHTETAKTPKGKLGTVVALMKGEGGTTVPEMMEATGWQAHSIRGALAGSLKKKYKFLIVSTKADGAERRYQIVEVEGDEG